MNVPKLILLNIIIISCIIIVLSGCSSSGSTCSKLPKIYCEPTQTYTCGCFDINKMVGGITGGTQDATSWRMAVIIRPDSVVEFYSFDSLEFRAKVESITQDIKTKRVRMTLVSSETVISIPTKDSLWVGSKTVIPDGASYLYIRNK